MTIIRWIPLLIILSASFVSLLFIVDSVTEFNKKRFAIVSLTYLTLLATILFTPLSFDGTGVYLMSPGSGQVNLHRIYYDLGFIENIILTIPLGFLIQKNFPKISLVSMVPVGLFVGASVETMQYYLSHLFLINRTSDISDVVANAAGIVIGAAFMLAYHYTIEKKLFEKNF